MTITDWLQSNISAVNQWASYLVSQGLSKSWSVAAASLYLLLHAYGLGPVITSVYRSPEKQAAMRAAYLSGNTSGLRYLPAKNSDHCHQDTNWLGQKIPGSYAVDIDLTTKRYSDAAYIAHLLGIRTGFEIGDEVHYFHKP